MIRKMVTPFFGSFFDLAADSAFLFVFLILHNIFHIAMQNGTEFIYGVRTNSLIMFKAGKSGMAYSEPS